MHMDDYQVVLFFFRTLSTQEWGERDGVRGVNKSRQ